MKKGIHPESYRLVAFKDMSNEDIFISKSTVDTKETIVYEGVEYPLVKLEISRTSHPYYTGKSKLIDTAGRITSSKTNTLNSKNRELNIIKKPSLRVFLLLCLCYTDTLYSLRASFKEVFLSVDSFLFPIIKAQGT